MAKKGQKLSKKICRKMSKSHLGLKASEKTKRKISESHKGNTWGFKKGHIPSERNRKINSLRMKGNKIGRKFRKGKEHWNYKDDRSKNFSPKRYGDDWDKIRQLIYNRDNFTCQDCGIKGIRLDVHHIIPFLISFDNSLNNLVTLCRSCHMKREVKL